MAEAATEAEFESVLIGEVSAGRGGETVVTEADHPRLNGVGLVWPGSGSEIGGMRKRHHRNRESADGRVSDKRVHVLTSGRKCFVRAVLDYAGARSRSLGQARLEREPRAYNRETGEVAERLIAPVLKTGVPQGIRGSNPLLSSRFLAALLLDVGHLGRDRGYRTDLNQTRRVPQRSVEFSAFRESGQCNKMSHAPFRFAPVAAGGLRGG